MLTDYDIELFIIKKLVENQNILYSKNKLYNEVKKEYPDIFPGYFLFIWEKILFNGNFMSIHFDKNINYIKIKTKADYDEIEKLLNYNINDVPMTVDFKVMIHHMVTHSELYVGTNIIEQFIQKISNSNKHINYILDNTDDSKKFKEIFLTNYQPVIEIPEYKPEILKKETSKLKKTIIYSGILGLVSLGLYGIYSKTKKYFL